LLKERERQRQLARERLMARKQSVLDGKGDRRDEGLVLTREDTILSAHMLADGKRRLLIREIRLLISCSIATLKWCNRVGQSRSVAESRVKIKVRVASLFDWANS
jgi:hypothetical protein